MLRWPRMYIWALSKARNDARSMTAQCMAQWCNSSLDGMPIPAPDIATTPTPRMVAQDAWRYNEDVTSSCSACTSLRCSSVRA